MRQSDEDMRMISGDFITADLPHDKSWLTRYFHSNLLHRFLVYYVTFPTLKSRLSIRYYCQSFIDHTGCHCSWQLLYKTIVKLRKLEKALDAAEKSRDFVTLSDLKLGSFNLKQVDI